ncbi:MAG: glutamine synthetase family protein [Neomegalonema sp.]|nr:glutamine synthetase family protein [Neomegalonema sp.]
MSSDSMSEALTWLRDHRVSEIECLVPDMAGIARGKILPTDKFITSIGSDTLRLPESIFLQTVTGDMIDSEVMDDTEPDVLLAPDLSAMRLVPWYAEPTAQVICDVKRRDGSPVEVAPRQVLRKVLALYEARGWCPVVAPELEFFLAEPNLDPDLPLRPPVGKSGRRESGRQSYSIDAVNEFDPMFEDMYDFCEAQKIDIDTLIHESGVAQVEINFIHGDALSLADQVFLFKRTIRQTAQRHNIYATFMAKPYEREPGSAMHIHQSLIDIESGENLFADENGKNTPLFMSYIAGLQRYQPDAMALIGPNVNSYRRLVRDYAAPLNVHWAEENRTVGLRIPHSGRNSRRVENRVPGADANPYIAFAASLICGYLGMVDGLEPTQPTAGVAYQKKGNALPRHILDALSKLRQSSALKRALGEDFVQVFYEVKMAEHEAYSQVISAWEREHLLLNV